MSPTGKQPLRRSTGRRRGAGGPPVVLAVADTAAAYAELLDGLAERGERAGWLELGAPVEAPPAGLEEAAAAGVLRAVAVGGHRVTTLKPIRGAAVLDDLLREHFRGCRVVLVRGGHEPAPVAVAAGHGSESGGLGQPGAAGLVRLVADGDGWLLASPAGRAVRQSTPELLASLRRPSFWRRLDGGPAAAGDSAGD